MVVTAGVTVICAVVSPPGAQLYVLLGWAGVPMVAESPWQTVTSGPALAMACGEH